MLLKTSAPLRYATPVEKCRDSRLQKHRRKCSLAAAGFCTAQLQHHGDGSTTRVEIHVPARELLRVTR